MANEVYDLKDTLTNEVYDLKDTLMNGGIKFDGKVYDIQLFKK
jgi:hypothetical protein